MFYLLLGLNGWTDWREGYVYDYLSFLLFVYSLLSTWMNWTLYSLGMVLFLVCLRLLDREERLLGRGDDLILLSISLYVGKALPLVMVVTSAVALFVLAIRRERQIPLIPFLWLGTVLVKAWIYFQ